MERGRIGHSGKAQDPARFVFGRGGWPLSRWLHHGRLRWPSRMALCTRCASIPPTARSWSSARQGGRNAPLRHGLHQDQSAGSIVEYCSCALLSISWIRHRGAREHGKAHTTISTAFALYSGRMLMAGTALPPKISTLSKQKWLSPGVLLGLGTGCVPAISCYTANHMFRGDCRYEAEHSVLYDGRWCAPRLRDERGRPAVGDVGDLAHPS